MLLTASLLIPLAGGMAAQLPVPPLPTDTDHLIGGGGKGRATILLDASCSMGWGGQTQACPTWNTAHGLPAAAFLDKNQMVRAAAMGCVTGNDGIFDRWANRIDFSIVGFGFGSGSRVRDMSITAPSGNSFSNDIAYLEGIVDTLPVEGGTPMAEGMHTSGLVQQNAWVAGTPGVDLCDNHYIVALTDGNANCGGCSPDFTYACDGATLNIDDTQPEQASQYLWNGGNAQITCNLNNGPVSTYTLGFGAPGSFNVGTLQAMANNGGGFYAYANSVVALSNAFDTILQSIVTRNAVFFGAPSIQNDGLFFGNKAYAPAMKPVSQKPWVGNLKKYCVVPDKLNGGAYDTTQTNCIFRSTDGINLIKNDAPVDEWTTAATIDTVVGGAGERFYNDHLGGLAPLAAPTWTNFYDRRQLRTWVPGGTGYQLARPSDVSDAMAGSSGCEKAKLFAYLHGYNPETVDCPTGNPTEVAEWPMGAFVNPGAVLLRYGDCETTGQCSVATAGTDGMVHLFDSNTGREFAGLIPGDTWTPNTVSDYRLADVLYQPTTQYNRLPLLDTEMVLLHDDGNGNGIIDNHPILGTRDPAFLVWGLGLTGRGYYFMDVSQDLTSALGTGALAGGSPHRVYPVVATPGTWTENFRGALTAPSIGRGAFGGGNERLFAAMSSGTDWASNNPTATFPPSAGLATVQTTPRTCNSIASNLGLPTLGLCSAPPGYDLAFGGVPFSQTFCMSVQNSTLVGNPRFNYIDLDPGDSITFTDLTGNPLAPPLVGPGPSPGAPYTVPFMTADTSGTGGDAGFCIQVNTDGIPTLAAGFDFDRIDVVHQNTPSPTGYSPFVVAVDLGLINNPTTPQAFDSVYQDGSQLALFTRACPAGAANCLDGSTDPDLNRMVCPISSKPKIYSEGGRVRGIYAADECGQVWRFWTDNNGTTWDASVILELNERFNPLAPGGQLSGMFRKIQTELDIVISGCGGSRTIGVYFGTGNRFRPAALPPNPDLQGAATVTAHHAGADVVGVVFDDGTITTPIRLNQDPTGTNTCGGACLVDATTNVQVDPKLLGFRGWAFRLRDNERVLRPLTTISGATFIKTFEPTQAPTQCTPGTGLDRVYRVDNCTAAPQNPNPNSTPGNTAADREVWSGNSEVGGGLLVYAPKDGDVIVSTGDIGADPNNNPAAGNLLPKPVGLNRGYKLYMYRFPTF